MLIGRPFTYPLFGFIAQNQWRAFTCYPGKPQIGPDHMACGSRTLPKRTQERIGSRDGKGLHIGRKASAHLLLHHLKCGL
jgi:hypothetical protein